MKKIVCGCFGNIYYATILKDGLMSDVNRVDVTDDAIDAVFQHIVSMDKFNKEGFAGYIIPICKKYNVEFYIRQDDENIEESDRDNYPRFVEDFNVNYGSEDCIQTIDVWLK